VIEFASVQFLSFLGGGLFYRDNETENVRLIVGTVITIASPGNKTLSDVKKAGAFRHCATFLEQTPRIPTLVSQILANIYDVCRVHSLPINVFNRLADETLFIKDFR
jgi:hypothetical protein